LSGSSICETLFDLGEKQSRRDTLSQEMESPTFWNNPEHAKRVIAELKGLNGILKPYEAVVSQADDLGVLVEMAEEAGDSSLDDEIREAVARANADFDAFELRSMLSGNNDHSNAYVTVHAGAGGTDACDFAEMLLRMYMMWAESHRYKVEIVNREEGGVAGVQEATIKVVGEYAYGYLKGEAGVHRLVRISPFDANARRQTSFASVDVLPEVDETIDIELKDADLKRDVFRAGGPGGQHQNKTESAVRYTHIPTGVAAESRSERSQFQNDALALQMLKAKLIRLEEMKREAEYAKAYDEKGDISFGYQIRDYVLQPYQLVKDKRSRFESTNPAKVLDGDLDGFIDAYLRLKLAKGDASSN
jgi:peptide chain release factor 2